MLLISSFSLSNSLKCQCLTAWTTLIGKYPKMVPQEGNSKHFVFEQYLLHFFFFYRFQYKNNIRIVSWNMKFICIRHETGKCSVKPRIFPFLSLIQIIFIFQDTIRILSKYLHKWSTNLSLSIKNGSPIQKKMSKTNWNVYKRHLKLQ